MKLQDEKSLFEAIDICEQQFKNWLIKRLNNKGVQVEASLSFFEMIKIYEGSLNGDRQHINPLIKWIEEKNKCHSIRKNYESNKKLDSAELDTLEQTAMDGAVLLMTFRNN